MNNDTIVKCLLCGNKVELKDSKFPGYQEPDTYKIYHCPTCNTSFSFPRISLSNIYENIYRNGNMVPGYDRYWRYMNKIKNSDNPLEYLAENEDTYWAVKEALSEFVIDKDSTKILEIGSGLGYLTHSLNTAQYNVVGIDISDTAVQQAKKIFGDHYLCADLFEFAKIHAESFDVVILTEVIEHVDRPLDFIESIKQLLVPGGHAIITTPNKSIFPSDVVWATELPPVHCWWFSEESMKFAAKEKDMKIDFINFRNFYKKNPLTINLTKIRSGVLSKPNLNSKGELVDGIVMKKNNNYFKFRSLIYRIPFFNKLYNFMIKMVIKDSLSCKDKGQILCTILQKSK